MNVRSWIEALWWISTHSIKVLMSVGIMHFWSIYGSGRLVRGGQSNEEYYLFTNQPPRTRLNFSGEGGRLLNHCGMIVTLIRWLRYELFIWRWCKDGRGNWGGLKFHTKEKKPPALGNKHRLKFRGFTDWPYSALFDHHYSVIGSVQI